VLEGNKHLWTVKNYFMSKGLFSVLRPVN